MIQKNGDLESDALARFDRLVAKEKLFWTQGEEVKVAQEPFSFQFRIAKTLTIKPNDPKGEKIKHPFHDDDSDFDLGQVGTKHRLILNKYCVVRPQFVLPTVEFEPQSDLLNEQDLGAAWEALTAFESPYMVIFNCGEDAGSSIRHKHLQLIPRPARSEHVLFPDLTPGEAANEVPSKHPAVPFQHVFYRFAPGFAGEGLIQIYNLLREQLSIGPGVAHNIVMVNEWFLVIPRSCGRVGPTATNAAGMVGMPWLKSKDELEYWISRGPINLLKEFGVEW